MGGYGSGRYGGRPTVESALRLDIDDMMQWGGIRAFARLAGGIRFNFYGDQIEVKFESRVGDPWESCLRLKYAMADYWTGEKVEIDDKIFLATTRGALMSLPTPPNERLSMTEPSGALASCA